MQKILHVLMVICITVVLLSGCGTRINPLAKSSTQTSVGSAPSASPEKEKLDITKMTAKEIIDVFVDSGLPVGKVIVYDENTDLNQLLGRPNQYTSKINFSDSRVSQTDVEKNPVGGSIEIFANKDDAQSRKNYIENFSKGTLAQYFYLYENVLLRIDHQLTPNQASQYENAFKVLQQGEKPIKIPKENDTLN